MPRFEGDAVPVEEVVLGEAEEFVRFLVLLLLPLLLLSLPIVT